MGGKPLHGPARREPMPMRLLVGGQPAPKKQGFATDSQRLPAAFDMTPQEMISMRLNRTRLPRQQKPKRQRRPPFPGLLPRSAPAALLIVTALSLIASPPALAAGIVDLDSRISVGNLHFAFSDPAAVLNWELDWYGEVGAYAHNRDGSKETGYWYVIGNNDSSATAAQVSGSLAQSDYQVVDGAAVTMTPGAGVAAGARTSIALYGGSQEADGYAYASLNNYFSISSPSPVGQKVSTAISLDYTGLAEVSTNPGAYSELLLTALLALYEINDANSGLIEPALGADGSSWRGAGRGLSLSHSLDGTVSVLVDIPYNALHWLYAEVESVAYAVPIAGALPLLLTGLGLLVGARRSRRSRSPGFDAESLGFGLVWPRSGRSGTSRQIAR